MIRIGDGINSANAIRPHAKIKRRFDGPPFVFVTISWLNTLYRNISFLQFGYKQFDWYA